MIDFIVGRSQILRICAWRVLVVQTQVAELDAPRGVRSSYTLFVVRREMNSLLLRVEGTQHNLVVTHSDDDAALHQPFDMRVMLPI